MYNIYIALARTSDGNGLQAKYFANRWLQGPAIRTQIDSQASFAWGSSPLSGSAVDAASVHWTGYVRPDYSGMYTFVCRFTQGDGKAAGACEGLNEIGRKESSRGETVLLANAALQCSEPSH